MEFVILHANDFGECCQHNQQKLRLLEEFHGAGLTIVNRILEDHGGEL